MKIGVFHPGTQHSWQTALALQQLDRLEWYATSIFYQPDRFPYRLERMVPARLAARLNAEFRRFEQPLLDPSLVRTAGLAEWLERLAARAGWRGVARKIDAIGNRRFVNTLAADIRSPAPFALWGYDGSSHTTFALARQHGRTCILDRTTPDFRYINAAVAELRERCGDWFLSTEREVPDSVIAQADREYALADTILVGSPFAAQTIRDAAPDPAIHAKLRVLEYGFDEALFAGLPRPARVDRNAPVKFLFLGLMIPRKGIHHVLEAISRIPRSMAELTIVGDMKIPRRIFARYADRVTFRPTVPRADVAKILQEHHVLVLPSYFEGAGIVLYEALAAGCALIQSDRCSPAVTPDTGLMLGTLDTDALHAAMMTAIEDRDLLDSWRINAQPAAERFTFARYRENIAELLQELPV